MEDDEEVELLEQKCKQSQTKLLAVRRYHGASCIFLVNSKKKKNPHHTLMYCV
jgi:hypothetical protein